MFIFSSKLRFLEEYGSYQNPAAPDGSRFIIRVCKQFAGAAEALVSQTEGPGVWSQAREHPTHIPALLPVQSHAQLSGRHEERGQLTAALCDPFRTAPGLKDVFVFAAAQQHDGVSVCGRAESGGVETALHQTPTAVQVRPPPIHQLTGSDRCSDGFGSSPPQSAAEPLNEVLERPATKGPAHRPALTTDAALLLRPHPQSLCF